MVISEEVNKNNELKEAWLKIAQENIWIKQRGSMNPNDDCAFEDPLTIDDFAECKTIKELYDKILYCCWILGQPFYYKNLCFINQVNAGDEWLVIRDNVSFESLTVGAMEGFEEFKEWIDCVMNATEEQIRKLEYTTHEYKEKWW